MLPVIEPRGTFLQFLCVKKILQTAQTDSIFPLIELDGEQINEMYRYFCYHFWKTAEFEIAIPEEIQQPPKTKNPFEEIILPKLQTREGFAHRLKEIAEKQMLKCCALSSLHQQNIFAPLFNENRENTTKSSWITSIQGNEEINLCHLSSSSTIHALPINHLHFAITQEDQGYYVLTSSGQVNNGDICILKLNRQQSYDFEGIFDELEQRSEYTFVGSRRLADIDTHIIFPKNPTEIIDIEDSIKQSQKLEAINCDDFDQFEEYRRAPSALISFIPKGLQKPIAVKSRLVFPRKVTWQITFFPPTLPRGVQRDQLYEQWRKAHNKYQKKITHLLEVIDKLEQTEDKLKSGVKELLKRFFLGKNVAIKTCRKKLAELSQITLDEFSKNGAP